MDMEPSNHEKEFTAKPFKGQAFCSLDEGIEYYREYAKRKGVDIRLSSSKKVQDQLIWQYVVCNRKGDNFVALETDMVNLEDMNPKIRRRVPSRCGCNAKVVFKYVAYIGYVVHLFVEEHNHDMVKAGHRQFMKVNRNMDQVHQKFILDCAKANIGPTASHRLLAELMGGNKSLGCSILEVRNFARDMRAYVSGCDAQMLLNEMKKRKELCETFIYDFDVDADDRLTRLFWCDPVSQMNYHIYGRVVAFDTTYSTNKYCMIFAPFTGKDNHGRPVTFAAGLLTKEDVSSFSWLFQKFVQCMGVHPKMIITDQDLGMKTTIEIELGGTRHRWCMWHIMMKVAEKITKELRADEEFKKELNACVWSEVIEPEYFEECWEGIMNKYQLNGNAWFDTMYENRQYWVPTYFRDFELSGLLKMTSISECENSFYKRYTRSTSNLMQFWMHYTHAIEAQRYQSLKLNYIDKTFAPSLCTYLYMEKHAARQYSAKMFIHLQEEISDAQSRTTIIEINVADGKQNYKLCDQYKAEYEVYCDLEGTFYECSCKIFKRMGFQCSHVLFVMKNKFVQTIPEKYIIDRWKKAHLIKPTMGREAEDMQQIINMDENKRFMSNITTTMYGWLQRFEGDSEKLTQFLTSVDDAGMKIAGNKQRQGSPDKSQMFENFMVLESQHKLIFIHPKSLRPKAVVAGWFHEGRRQLSRRETTAALQ